MIREQQGELLGTLNDFDHAPAFVLAERAGFHDTDGVADVAFVLLIVSHELGGLLDELAVLGVFDLTLDEDDDRLVHLVAHHDADSFFS